MKTLAILFLLTPGLIGTNQQSIEVTGHVYDESGKGLPGMNN